MKKYKIYNITKVCLLSVFVVLFLISCMKKEESVFNETITDITKGSIDNKENEYKYIEELFKNAKDNIQPATAGTSLKSAIHSTKILDAFFKNDFDTDKIYNDIKENFTDIDDTKKFELKETFDMLLSSMDSLKGENAKDLLESAGVNINDCSYPWNEVTFKKVTDIIYKIKELL